MKILITGGGGFLGARLARTLLSKAQLNGQTISAVMLADQQAPPEDLLAQSKLLERYFTKLLPHLHRLIQDLRRYW